MKKIFIIGLSLLLNLSFALISPAQNSVTFKGDNFGFGQITSANGFFDGTFGYLIGGQNDLLRNEVWQYNISLNEWKLLDTIPFPTRHSPICEKINQKVYYGLGIKNGVKGEHDFYEYDLDSNVWHRLADFPGDRRALASSFVINDKLYVGLGDPMGNPLSSFWEYNPQNNQWNRKADFPGTERFGAFAFTLNNKGYIGGGLKSAPYLNDFWEYNSLNDTWTQKANLPAPVFGAIALVINNKPYILGGQVVYRYNEQLDSWEEFPISKEFTSRIYGFGFTVDHKAFFGTGTDGNKKFSDWWEFDPSLLGVGVNEKNLTNNALKIYPNPSNGAFSLDLQGAFEPTVKISIFNSLGELMWETESQSNGIHEYHTPIKQSGIYLLKVSGPRFTHIEKVVVE